MNRWVVDSEHVVHAGHCVAVGAVFLPYATDPAGMHAWLARPDVRDSHSGPAVITACPICIEVTDEPDL